MTAEGDFLQNRYLLLSRLGSGGQGSVWLAGDQLLGRDVALKELVPNVNGIDLRESRVRALREARAMAKVKDPAVVRILDVFHVRGDPWIVMDYIRGRSLGTIIQDDPPLDERAVAAIGLPVLRGLRAVHAAGIVHRDVKPANIVRADDEGSIFLVDFGIATIEGDTSITGKSQVLGTTEFMAPERLRGRPAGPPADLWSLGVTLFCALERCSPFLRRGEGSMQATISAILHDEPPPMASRGMLADIMRRMLRKDPSGRPDAAAVEAVLAAVAAPGGQRATAQRATAQRITAQRTGGMPGDRGYRETRRHETAGPRPDTPASRLRIPDAVEILSSSSTDSGVALLLGMADDRAANVLARCSRQVAGHLLQDMAVTQPKTAGSILHIFPVRLRGEVLGHIRPAAAAMILTAMPVAEAARILDEADTRTAARGMAELPGDHAGQLLTAMEEPHAAEVLGHVPPSGVAAMLAAVPRDLRNRLLARLAPGFRDLVRRNMRGGPA